MNSKYYSIHRILTSMVTLLGGHYAMAECSTSGPSYTWKPGQPLIGQVNLSTHCSLRPAGLPTRMRLVIDVIPESETDENSSVNKDNFEWLDMNELWRYERGRFSIYQLSQESSIELTRSQVFPVLSAEKVLEFINKIDETTNDFDEYLHMGEFLFWLKQQDPQFSDKELFVMPLVGLSLVMGQGLQKIDDYFKSR